MGEGETPGKPSRAICARIATSAVQFPEQSVLNALLIADLRGLARSEFEVIKVLYQQHFTPVGKTFGHRAKLCV